MTVDFSKMNGAGNDFVVIENLGGNVVLDRSRISRICDRRRGVGADGLILIETAKGNDFFMHFFNSDGTEAEMCGNGARCAAYFAVHACELGEPDGEKTRVHFATGSGDVVASVRAENVSMDLMDAASMRLDVTVPVAGGERNVHFMTVGTRHVVVPVEDARALDSSEIVLWGRAIRHHPEFGPQGANVNFSSIDTSGRIHIRTYEKGVEAETHACGTGSVASAVAFAHQGRLQSPAVAVQKRGEVLEMSFDLAPTGATNVRLGGPVSVNFVGTMEI